MGRLDLKSIAIAMAFSPEGSHLVVMVEVRVPGWGAGGRGGAREGQPLPGRRPVGGWSMLIRQMVVGHGMGGRGAAGLGRTSSAAPGSIAVPAVQWALQRGTCSGGRG